MLGAWVAAIVGFCAGHARAVVAASLILATASTVYLARHFAVNTDPVQLISPDVAWRKLESEVDRAFPQRTDLLVIVVEGPTAESAELGSRQLAAAIAARPDVARSTRRPDAGRFFEENGLLFQSPAELDRTATDLATAQPFLAIVAEDPSIRGMFRAIETWLLGLSESDSERAAALKGVARLGDALKSGMTPDAPAFSWRAQITGQPASPQELRRFITVQPRLDFSDLEPGRAASNAIREMARVAGLTADNGYKVRMTGPVALSDDEFASVAENAGLNLALTLLAVTVILWLALHSGRLIVAVLINLLIGLVVTGAAGLAIVGQFNLISVAFAVLFIGLGVDFAIQLGVRYRELRRRESDLSAALVEAARQVAGPLTLAAACLMAGFYAFLPTEYRGLSELGVIAGTGMAIALVCSLTIFPAFVVLLRPGPETRDAGLPALAVVDSFLAHHRRAVLVGTAILFAASLAGVRLIHFDGNPLNLRDPRAESVATLMDLGRNAISNPNTIDVLAPSVEAATALAARLESLPSVARVVTLTSFVPQEQQQKLDILEGARFLLAPALDPPQVAPSPDDAALRAAAAGLRLKLEALAPQVQSAPEIRELLALLARFDAATPQNRALAQARLSTPLRLTLEQIATALRADSVTLDALPADLVADWRSADGRVRLEVVPKSGLTDTESLVGFVSEVRTIAPDASGGAVTIVEAGRTVVRAFVEAGLIAFVAITLILWLALRRVFDVAWTVLPLLASGLFTLLVASLLGTPLNFANIIALPLMFGVGVAFHIYYVIAWREGVVDVLQTSLTRAILFSALTTAAAFGSLWLSSHPGTASMGKLLAISLGFTLWTAFVIVPACLGPARHAAPGADAKRIER